MRACTGYNYTFDGVTIQSGGCSRSRCLPRRGPRKGGGGFKQTEALIRYEDVLMAMPYLLVQYLMYSKDAQRKSSVYLNPS